MTRASVSAFRGARFGIVTVTTLSSFVALALTSFAAQFEKDATGHYVWHDGVKTFAIDPTQVSLRLAAGIDVDAFLTAAATRNPLLLGLTTTRSNCLSIHDLAVPAGRDPIAIVNALAALPGVLFAEPSAIGEWHATPNDPQFGQQYFLNNTGQNGGKVDADIDAPEAWNLADGSPSIVIAPIDSGFQLDHPDLVNAFWHNAGEIPGNGIDDDHNGFVDDNIGWDFGTNDNQPGPDYPHGTWVMGVIGASSNNSIGVAGVAGGAVDGQGCKVMAVSLGPSPSNTTLDDAILYAANNGARVITLSLGLPQSAGVDAALVYAAGKNVFIDCSAGNGGPVGYPASSSYVMAVGGTDNKDSSGFFSSGPKVEVAAASLGVYTTAVGSTYAAVDGTSFASPQVAGLAGLVLSLRPDLAAEQVRKLIRTNADDVFTAGFDNYTGNGRINAFKTLVAAGTAIAAVTETYGTGSLGTLGIPLIGTNLVAPMVGASTFAITLKNARSNAPTLFLLGIAQASIPTHGGILLVSPAPVLSIFSATTSAAGNLVLPAGIPNDPALGGANAYFQWIVTDPASPFGIAFTPGLHLTIGS